MAVWVDAAAADEHSSIVISATHEHDCPCKPSYRGTQHAVQCLLAL